MTDVQPGVDNPPLGFHFSHRCRAPSVWPAVAKLPAGLHFRLAFFTLCRFADIPPEASIDSSSAVDLARML